MTISVVVAVFDNFWGALFVWASGRLQGKLGK